MNIGSQGFTRFSDSVSRIAGRPSAFVMALLSTVIWAVLGPWFHYSDSWMLWINTGTTIVTFLMVFILQHSQNRDGLAIQAKLDALIKSSAASNAFIRLEAATPEEIEAMRNGT